MSMSENFSTSERGSRKNDGISTRDRSWPGMRFFSKCIISPEWGA